MTRLLLIHAGFYVQQMNWDNYYKNHLPKNYKAKYKNPTQVAGNKQLRIRCTIVGNFQTASLCRCIYIVELCITTLIMVYSHCPTPIPLQKPIKMHWIDLCVHTAQSIDISTRFSKDSCWFINVCICLDIGQCELTRSVYSFMWMLFCSASVLSQIFETAMILHSRANWITLSPWLWKQWGRNLFYRLFRCK